MADQDQNKITVEEGDTLSGIAQREGLGASQWEDLGGIPEDVQQDPTKLQSGTELTLPERQEEDDQDRSVDPISDEVDADELQRGDVDINYSEPMKEEERFVTDMSKQVDRERTRLEKELQRRRERVETETQEVEGEREDLIEEKDELSEPFREDLQKREREELYINENFEESQNLVDEMDSLLQEGNDLIKQQEEVTGLEAVRNPRIQKTMDDVTARTGVIESVLQARKGQISQGQNMIDRSMDAISQDRQERRNYYDTLLELNESDMIDLDDESKQLAEQEIELISSDLEMAEQSAQTIKDMMVDPSNAELMGKARVKMTDSPEEINKKLADAQYQEEVYELHNEMRSEGAKPISDPSQVPDEQLEEATDSRGNTHYYKVDAEDEFSTSTLRVLEGGESLDNLTSSRRQEVEDELFEAGLSPHRKDYTDEFRDIMEEMMGSELGDEELQEMWDEYRTSMQNEGEEGEETAGDFFSNTQISKGANNADMTIEEFKELSVDEANEYINEESDEEESDREL
ncbi:MAG: hypothetical protein ACOC5D_04990 [Thermoplasmatota archaeon]